MAALFGFSAAMGFLPLRQGSPHTNPPWLELAGEDGAEHPLRERPWLDLDRGRVLGRTAGIMASQEKGYGAGF
jgi:hypothetical protein